MQKNSDYREINKLKYKFILLIVGIFLFGLVSASDSIIRDGTCNAGETCMFSMWQMNDSHVAACGYYNFSVCYPETKPTTIRDGNCNAGEYSLLTTYQMNDSHIGETGYFNFSICVTGSNETYFQEDASACNAGDRGIASFYQRNDSHVGAIGYYNFTLCENNTITVIDTTPPTITDCRNFTHLINTQFSDTIHATDASGIDGYFLNDTTYFNISRTTGLITNLTNLTRFETYNLNLTVNDTNGNAASCSFWIDVNVYVPTGTGTTPICTYSKYGYYNLNLPWFRQANCMTKEQLQAKFGYASGSTAKKGDS